MLTGGIPQDLCESRILVEEIDGMPGKEFIIKDVTFAF